jgi:hypothetical protein
MAEGRRPGEPFSSAPFGLPGAGLIVAVTLAVSAEARGREPGGPTLGAVRLDAARGQSRQNDQTG